MAEVRIRRRVIVRGRVQGVFFRGATARRAELSGAHGWVRNRPDGSVEAVFEGAPEAVEEMLRFCRVGPPAARVEGVEELEERPEEIRGFAIR